MEQTQSKIVITGRQDDINSIEYLIKEDGRYIVTQIIILDDELKLIPLKDYIDRLFIKTETKKYKYDNGKDSI